eukprot:scaffold9453_cov84-Skeletonema_dohrnii-CCMP3373.AAC.1
MPVYYEMWIEIVNWIRMNECQGMQNFVPVIGCSGSLQRDAFTQPPPYIQLSKIKMKSTHAMTYRE